MSIEVRKALQLLERARVQRLWERRNPRQHLCENCHQPTSPFEMKKYILVLKQNKSVFCDLERELCYECSELIEYDKEFGMLEYERVKEAVWIDDPDYNREG